MFKGIGAIVSTVKDGLEILTKIETRQDEKKRRRLAQVLHLVYLRLNETIATGEQLLDSLQVIVAGEHQLSRSLQFSIEVDGVGIDELISLQSKNLNALDQCISEYAKIIEVIDRDMFLALHQFVAFKGVGIHWIATLLDRGLIPFDALGLDDLGDLIEVSEHAVVPVDSPLTDKNDINLEFGDFLIWYDRVAKVSNRIDGHNFEYNKLLRHDETDFDRAIEPKQLQELSQHLLKNDLREHLDQAKRDMLKIKSYLEDNFSTVDLMIDVSSDQLRRKGFMERLD